MPETLVPIVVTRRGNTTHEDTGAQASRLTDYVWQTLAKQREQRVIIRAAPGSLSHVVLAHEDKESFEALRNTSTHDTLASNGMRFAEALAEPLEVAEDLSAIGDAFRELHETFAVACKELSVAAFTRATGETSTLVSWLETVHHATMPDNESDIEWTENKNQRRCRLVDKEIDGTLSAAEKVELDQLQAEMLAYRHKVAPLPLEELRELHQDLLRQASN